MTANVTAAARQGDAGRVVVDAILGDRFVPLCALAFIVLRLLVILFVPITPISDGAWYWTRAVGMAQGEGYVEQGLPTAYWPIGYPAFLAGLFYVFGAHILVGQIANLLLGLATFALVYKVSKKIFGNEVSARLAVLMFTIYPNQIAYTAALMTETFFTFLFMLSCYIFIRRPSVAAALGAGAVAGLATLTKTQTLAFPVALIAIYAWQNRTAAGVARAAIYGCVLYMAAATVIAPWTIRNYAVFGAFIPVSTNGGLSLVSGNSPNANGDHISVDQLPNGLRPSVADQVEMDRKAKDYAINWIKENPDKFAALVPRKIWRLWAPDGEGEWWFQGGYEHYERWAGVFRTIRFANQGYYALLLACFGLSLVTLLRQRRLGSQWALLGFTVALFTTAISAIVSGQSRYHHPAMPWIMIYAAWQIEMWMRPGRSAPRP